MPRSDLDERFADYHRENPQVYAQLVAFAREARSAGRARCGIKLCVERLRWETFVRAGGEFKVNNLWAARYARLIEEREPDLRGFFTTRRPEPVSPSRGTVSPSRLRRSDDLEDFVLREAFP